MCEVCGAGIDLDSKDRSYWRSVLIDARKTGGIELVAKIRRKRWEHRAPRPLHRMEDARTDYGDAIGAKIYAHLAQELEGEPCCDNYRWARAKVQREVRAYRRAQRGGCCGFYDGAVEIDGVTYLVGANFGH